jgi:hypothetical protein
MFELHIDPNADISTGSIAISWCVDKDLIKTLTDNGVVDPQVVIVVAAENIGGQYTLYETRYVVPLTELMTYITFKKPGKNNVFAFVSAQDRKSARTTYLTTHNGIYETTVVDNNEWSIPSSMSETNTPPNAAPVLSLDIPKECFAKEPSELEKTYVNWMFSNKAVDQCDFRKRRLFAYTIQVPMVLLSFIVRFVMCGVSALAFGWRGFKFEYLNPFSGYDLGDSVRLTYDEGTFFIRKLPEDKDHIKEYSAGEIAWYVLRKICLLPFMPIVFTLIVMMVLNHRVAVIMVGLMTMIICIAVVLLIVAFFASGAFREVFDALMDKFLAPPTKWYKDKEEVDLLLCSNDKKPLSVATLQRKSIRLRFQDIKARVCKPFAR